MTHQMLTSVRAEMEKHFATRQYFACVYGSLAYGAEREDSDLDLFIATRTPTDSDRCSLAQMVIDLHQKHGLMLDIEVPYENKLVVSFEDLAHMMSLDAFPMHEGRRTVPRVERTEAFLGSHEVRWRLLLNALTTPNLFLCGDKALYDKYRLAAEASVRRLAHELSPNNPLSGLLYGPAGEEGEEYLGYKRERAQVMEHLVRILDDASIAP